ncbi:hypothetical protein PWG71_27095 [Nocardiopsis sp. N85]|uniref:hypothetical protein n=1 Tax=Nocardiopsis sp. N85 TaxID=3029400 RepID=UPI00237EEC7B|nr:hypothetical protein [Nocardiopsis sp. N85]MDE3725065.1 hypothetical protein [Nocardiopsis sp. N85]
MRGSENITDDTERREGARRRTGERTGPPTNDTGAARPTGRGSGTGTGRADTAPVAVDAEVRDPGTTGTTVPAQGTGRTGPAVNDERPGKATTATGGTRSEGRDTPVEGDRDRSGSRQDVDRERVRERLTTAMNGFVDDPGKAVGEADAVVDEVTEAVISRLRERRSGLRSAWEEGADTERLRLALREHRAFVDDLLDGRF